MNGFLRQEGFNVERFLQEENLLRWVNLPTRRGGMLHSGLPQGALDLLCLVEGARVQIKQASFDIIPIRYWVCGQNRSCS